MELIAAILLAGPLGYFGRTRKRGLIVYLLLWLAIIPIQTAVVYSEDSSDFSWAYALVNAAILALGIGLNQLGLLLRRRRAGAPVAG